MIKNKEDVNNFFENNSHLKDFAEDLYKSLLYNVKLEKALNSPKVNLAENNGCVVFTIDSNFGNGKTLFLKEFKKHYLKEFKEHYHNKQQSGFRAIIYLDAWQQDYLNNPVLSIVRQILSQEQECIKKESKKKLKKATYNLIKIVAKLLDKTQILSESMSYTIST